MAARASSTTTVSSCSVPCSRRNLEQEAGRTRSSPPPDEVLVVAAPSPLAPLSRRPTVWVALPVSRGYDQHLARDRTNVHRDEWAAAAARSIPIAAGVAVVGASVEEHVVARIVDHIDRGSRHDHFLATHHHHSGW